MRFEPILAFLVVTSSLGSNACSADVDLGGSTDASASAVDACGCATLGPDGGAYERCGRFAPPDTASTCHACARTSSTCQTNGCFGGFWCDVARSDCREPLPTCR